MFIIWSGHGYLVLLTMIVSFVSADYATEASGIAPNAATAIAAFVAAAIVHKMHKFFSRRGTGLSIVDDETGDSTPVVAKHDLYWIPMKYWAFILAGAGLWFTYTAIETAVA